MKYRIKVTKAVYDNLEWVDIEPYNDGCTLDDMKVIGIRCMDDLREGYKIFFLDEDTNKYYIYETFIECEDSLLCTRLAELPSKAVTRIGAHQLTPTKEETLSAILKKMRRLLKDGRMITEEDIGMIRRNSRTYSLEEDMKGSFAYGYYCGLVEMKEKLRKYSR